MTEDEGHISYLKGARQDPSPWESTAPPTAPQQILTPALLEEMDEAATRDPGVPLTRVQAGRARRRKKTMVRLYVLGLALGIALAFGIAVVTAS